MGIAKNLSRMNRQGRRVSCPFGEKNKSNFDAKLIDRVYQPVEADIRVKSDKIFCRVQKISAVVRLLCNI